MPPLVVYEVHPYVAMYFLSSQKGLRQIRPHKLLLCSYKELNDDSAKEELYTLADGWLQYYNQSKVHKMCCPAAAYAEVTESTVVDSDGYINMMREHRWSRNAAL